MPENLLDGPKEHKTMVPMSMAMIRWLKDRANQERRPVAQIVRFAIAEYADRQEQQRPKTTE